VKFCEDCGARLGVTCAQCAAEITPGKRFCGSCGAPVAAPAAIRFAAPEAYTPKHLAEKILTSRRVLEGERKQVTVLFADLKGSMELLADRDPEEAPKLLDPVLERMMEAVHRYEGTVNQVMGDGIMALFGAPIGHEDHAVRACYAALRMQESVKRYAEEVRRTEGIPIQIRVGLNSGEVVVRSIGSDLRMEYTAVGQTTHLAARLEQMAVPDSILTSPGTLRLAGGFVVVKPLGPMAVRGLDGPMEVYEVTGAGTVRSRMEAAAARGLTRFVGRGPQLETVRQALEKAGAGHGQVVALVGEPGVGKSRLVWELIHSHRTHGWLVLESGSASYGKATPYLPVIDLLKTYFQIEPRDDARRIREKVTGKLLSLDRALEPSLPALLALLDVPVEEPQWQDLDPSQRRQRTLEAVKRTLLRECQVQPLCLVFEDLHWIDMETQAILDRLIDSLPSARLLVLVNYRPEYQHGWGSKTYYTQLGIDPLPPESTEELLRTLLGGDPGLEPLKRLLLERTEGNPLFLEESARTLIETQVLVGERGAYRLANAITSIQVPPTVQAILAARIDRVPAEEKHILQAAAVIGTDVPLALLQAVVELPEEELRRHLTHLQAAEFLYEARLFPELEYTFKHALTCEVTYGSLLQERRRALHARIVQAIEHLHSERLPEHVERLAHHAFRGEVWEKAVGYLRQAGTKAALRSANREAVVCFERALDALGRLPETRHTLEQGIDIRVDLGPALTATKGAAAPEVERTYASAQELCQRLGATSRLFPTLWGLWFVRLFRSELAAARSLGEELLILARRSQDPGLLLEAHHTLWPTLVDMGEFVAARNQWEQGLALYDSERHGSYAFRYGNHDPGVCSRNFAAHTLWFLGYPDQALAMVRDALALARQLAHPYSLAVAQLYGAMVHLECGQRQAAEDLANASVTLSAEHGFAALLPRGLILRGRLRAARGDWEEGMAELRRGLATYRVIAEGRRCQLLAVLGDACAECGQVEEGLDAVSEALTLADRTGERCAEAELHRLKGELLRRQPLSPDHEAETCFQKAIEVARQQSAKSLELRAVTSLARLLHARGRREQASTSLASTYGWFTEGFDTADLRAARALAEELS
jgi:class 3 adenylate cyclase/predicted ATPase